MTIHLSIILWLPAATGVVALFLPARAARWVWLLGTIAVLGYAVTLLADYDRAAGGLQYVTDELWIPSLGIHYALAISGLNLVLIATTALAFTAAAAWYLWDASVERPGLFALLMGPTMQTSLRLFSVSHDPSPTIRRDGVSPPHAGGSG